MLQSQFCTFKDRLSVAACAKLGHEFIIIFHIMILHIFKDSDHELIKIKMDEYIWFNNINHPHKKYNKLPTIPSFEPVFLNSSYDVVDVDLILLWRFRRGLFCYKDLFCWWWICLGFISETFYGAHDWVHVKIICALIDILMVQSGGSFAHAMTAE